MRFALLILILPILSACGNSSIESFPKSTLTDGSQAQNSVHRVPSPKKNPFETLSYEFQDSLSGCSTGVKNFSSTHELCMKLLDSDFNQRCAEHDRYTSFFRLCGPKGYLPQDGLQCQVGVLKPSVINQIRSGRADECYSQFSKSDFSTVHEVCIGRKIGSRDEHTLPLRQTLPLASNLNIEVDALYSLPAQLSETHFTHFKGRLVSFEETGTEVEFVTGTSTKVGCTIETLQQYRVFIACKPTLGCRQ